MNKITRTSQTTSNTYNSNFNANTPLWSETNSSEEKDIGIRKDRNFFHDETKNKRVKEKISEEG